ncbi:MAG: exodeoxyribonuclease VII small subunit [Archangium sp.]|nr:exodeoxyribonuclease VII small subunit [Archangium sp.]MDP3155522.1 exodeoxyribonuclease VII small subunit [Archangium sp.]MDP3573854.1 exodeoxyribonuclease VII small subunit [Archangium sp.]
MAKEKNAARGQYGDVVTRLQEIVEALEGGELSLEDSLDRFAEGITLVKQGEGILGDAEKRIEQLLAEDGRTAPLKVPEGNEPPAAPQAKQQPPPVVKKAPVAPAADDDVPF